MAHEYELLFGYTHVSGIPPCDCRDPGNYAMLECIDNTKPLECQLVCWCGARAQIKFDSLMERAEFIAMQTKEK